MKKVLVFLILLSCSTNDDVQIQTEPTTIPTNTTLSIDVDPDVSFANFVDYWTKNLKNYRPISNDDLKTTNELGKWPDTILINDSITCYLRVVGTVTVGVADENHPVEFDSHLNLQWWLAESYVCNDDLITNLYGPPFFQDNEWWIFAATNYPEKFGTDSLYKECGYPCSPVAAVRFATRVAIDLSDNSVGEVYDIDLDTLFFDDYYAVKWNQDTITWNFAEEQIVTAYEEKEYSVFKPTKQRITYTTNAFQLWDDALDSINFKQSQNPDNADITIGIVDEIPGRNNGYWGSVWDENNEITFSTIIIEKNLDGALYLTTILHEIGNILGLGDISPRQDIRSIQEDPFPEIFVGSSLWEFDVQMIKQLYGENNN